MYNVDICSTSVMLSPLGRDMDTLGHRFLSIPLSPADTRSSPKPAHHKTALQNGCTPKKRPKTRAKKKGIYKDSYIFILQAVSGCTIAVSHTQLDFQCVFLFFFLMVYSHIPLRVFNFSQRKSTNHQGVPGLVNVDKKRTGKIHHAIHG